MFGSDDKKEDEKEVTTAAPKEGDKKAAPKAAKEEKSVSAKAADAAVKNDGHYLTEDNSHNNLLPEVPTQTFVDEKTGALTKVPGPATEKDLDMGKKEEK